MKNESDNWFQVVEIAINSKCNRRCTYCPQHLDEFRQPEYRMPIQVYERIINQLADIQFSGRLSFHWLNEPLLRKDLENIVSIARNKLPLCWLVIYSNGDLLTDVRYRSLIDAGVDKFIITSHDANEIPNRDFQSVQFPGEFILTNRGGTIGLHPAMQLPCYAPSEILIIRSDGKVLICHEDASSKQIMGDVTQQTIREIWFGEEFSKIRNTLRNGGRDIAGLPCSVCNHRFYTTPDSAIIG